MISGPKGERSVAVTGFYHPLGNMLETDEMITEIRIPRPAQNNRQVFIKHRVRDTIDFATVSLGLVASMDGETVADARIVLGAVAGAKPLSRNAYKIEIAKALIRRSILDEN